MRAVRSELGNLTFALRDAVCKETLATECSWIISSAYARTEAFFVARRIARDEAISSSLERCTARANAASGASDALGIGAIVPAGDEPAGIGIGIIAPAGDEPGFGIAAGDDEAAGTGIAPADGEAAAFGIVCEVARPNDPAARASAPSDSASVCVILAVCPGFTGVGHACQPNFHALEGPCASRQIGTLQLRPSNARG